MGTPVPIEISVALEAGLEKVAVGCAIPPVECPVPKALVLEFEYHGADDG